MRFSLITLCFNKLAVTQRCLESVLNDSQVEAPWELIAVDNGSSDGTRAWLEGALTTLGASRGVPVKVLAFERNVGCSTARNAALAAASGDRLVFLDNDVAPRTRAWLPRLDAVLESNPRAALAGPKLLLPRPPFDIQCAGVGISRLGHVCFQGRGERRDDPRFNRPGPVQCLISACLLARADLVRAAGGFDAAFNPVQFEDFDLCYRLRRAGWEAHYAPEVEMYHVESTTTQGTPGMVNAAVVVRNGLTFQHRWKPMFATEDGPAETACRWRQIPSPPIEQVGPLPLV